MAERELELRLRAAVRTLDRQAPAFDVGRLPAPSTRRATKTTVAVVCVLAMALGATAAPAAVSAIRGLFHVDVVSQLGPLEPGVAPPGPGRSVPVDVVQATAPFRVWTIRSLGLPSDARVRDDVVGGMVTLVYPDETVLTQWRTADASARVAVVPGSGSAQDVEVGESPGLWIEGGARGTLRLTGADATIHRESFDVGPGALLWKQDGRTLLLQATGSRARAVDLGREVGP
jgi:hypothetical protein